MIGKEDEAWWSVFCPRIHSHWLTMYSGLIISSMLSPEMLYHDFWGYLASTLHNLNNKYLHAGLFVSWYYG